MEGTAMNTSPTLATRFSRQAVVLRTGSPLSEDQMRGASPSVFAESKHCSRSERYTYIPTIEVLRGLLKEGFEPFEVAQGACRIEGKAAFTKHMVRMRHADQAKARAEANEIILINSHDGASCYQLLCGLFRFICHNGLVVGDVVEDIRVRHTGDVRDEVIEGAFRVLDEFEQVEAHAEAMKALPLEPAEELAFASGAHALRFGVRTEADPPAPITPAQLLDARRPEDLGHDLWTILQRTSENLLRGGLPGRTARGQRMHTRRITSIDGSVTLNRALWMLAEEMHRIKQH
jgi:hypothetical protein